MAPRHIALNAPRRWILAIFSVVAFFILGTYLVSNPSEPNRRGFDVRSLRPDEPIVGKRTTGDKYLLGVGKADITGPVVEINFGGYAYLSQTGTGLRQRLFARAFIVADATNTDDRFVYLILDTQSGDTAVRYGILEAVAALGDEYSVYGQSNIAVVGTHQHSGPGAWFNYLLPQITSLGFDKQSADAIIDGSVLAIQRAHENITEGYLDVGTVDIDDGNLSRSLYAYMNNPAEERAQYSTTTDKTMTVLRFQRASDSKNMGILTWFPVHGTSAYENNTHVTGDNKGVASYLFEKDMENDDNAAEGFVAGFSQANVGDTTPNVLGAWCDDGSGEQCTYENSTCKGISETCHGRGPDFAALDLGISSCYEMGRRQYAGALSVYDDLVSGSSSTPVVGSTVKSFHFYHNMSFWNFQLPNGTAVQTCPAALGYSFAAGTTDGPGDFDFTQADSGSYDDPLWEVVGDLLKTPSAAQTKCQGEKPIILDVGEMSEPYAWAPNIVDIQVLRVGQFHMIISPSEATTMTGRRWRNAIAEAAAGVTTDETPIVVLGGPANTYAHYCATPEEYEIQRYEGASTLFGKWESYAYINLTVSNIEYLAPDSTSSPAADPSPPDNYDTSLSFITGVVEDNAQLGYDFGDVITQPNESYARGAVVNTTFVGANPRNNLRLEGTYAAIERYENGNWTQVMDDYDWHLVYTWTRTNTVLGYSQVVISWETQSTDTAGTYRTKYYGDWKALLTGDITAFTATSDSYTLS